MLYKSSILTASFFLLSILAPRGYANGQAIAAEPPTGQDSNSDLQSASSAQPHPQIVADAMSRSATPVDSIEPLDLVLTEPSISGSTTPKIDRIGKTIEISLIDVVVNPDLPLASLAMGYVSPLREALPVERPVLAQTPGSSTSTEPKKWAVGVHAQASTTGFIGVDGGYKFSPNLHARLGLNTVGFNTNYSSEGIDYSASFKPTNIHLLGDYFPFGGGLRLTGGLVAQNNQFTAISKSNSSSQININGTNYNASEIGTVEGEGKFSSSIAPYLGIGFGTPISSGFGFNIDAGVLFAGSPTVKLRTNNISSSVPAVLQAQLQSDLAEQERKTNEDIKDFKVYPVISIGFSYAF